MVAYAVYYYDKDPYASPLIRLRNAQGSNACKCHWNPRRHECVFITLSFNLNRGELNHSPHFRLCSDSRD